VIVAVFVFAAYGVTDPTLKDSFTATWLGLSGISAFVGSVAYLKYGHEIIKALKDAMDQSVEVIEAKSRLKNIRNQAVVGTLIPGIALVAFAVIPYLRSSIIYFFCVLWTYLSINNLVYIHNLRKIAGDRSSASYSKSSGGASI